MKKLVFATLVLACLPSLSFAAPSDFNNDGTSDIAAVAVAEDLSWASRINGVIEIIAPQFGKLGDHLVPGKYSSTSTQPAVLKSNFNWRVKTETGTKFFTHGEEDVLYLAGADFDGDGFTDAAYTTEHCSRKVSTLKILANPLSENPTEHTITGGRGNSFKVYADVNNDGRDEYCFTKTSKINGAIQQDFDLVCLDSLSGVRVDQFSIGKIFSTPLRQKTATGADNIVTVNPKTNKVIINIFNVNGKNLKRVVIPGTGIVLVGNFTNTDTATEQIALANGSLAKVYDLDADTITEAIAPNGIHFDELNIVSFKEDQGNNCQCSTRHIKLYGRCPSNTGCAINRDIQDGPNGFLHKPISDTTGSVVNLLPRGEIGDGCRYEDASGQLFRETYFSSIGNGDRAHYRPIGGGSCSGFPAPLTFSCSIDGIRNCWTMPNPCIRYD